MRPALVALLIQLVTVAVALALIGVLGLPGAWWWPLQACLASLASIVVGQPRWWWLIHATFAPALVLALWLDWSPWWWLAAFVLAALLFGRVDRSRVPLYLSNRQALQALDQLIAGPARVLDLGAGTGTVLAWLARRQDLRVDGIEHAWLTCLIARGRLALQRSRARVWRGDMMALDLADYDVVYAFLSPAAMPALWRKAKQEMRSGSLLVSNSFVVPGVPADSVLELNDWKGARLYLWRMP